MRPAADALMPLAQRLDEGQQAGLSLAAAALGDQDGVHLIEAAVDVVVHQDIVVLRPVADLVGRFRHPPGALVVAVQAA